jgi:hypothetical protein
MRRSSHGSPQAATARGAACCAAAERRGRGAMGDGQRTPFEEGASDRAGEPSPQSLCPSRADGNGAEGPHDRRIPKTERPEPRGENGDRGREDARGDRGSGTAHRGNRNRSCESVGWRSEGRTTARDAGRRSRDGDSVPGPRRRWGTIRQRSSGVELCWHDAPRLCLG